MEKQILCNRIQTPDGTILTSHHRHDYVSYIDKNGHEYVTDGGCQYIRRNIVQEAPYKDLTVYDDAPFEEIRKVLYRGGTGKDGTKGWKYVALDQMSDNWLKNVITFEEKLRPDNKYLKYYRKEVEYRKDNNIRIEE